MDLLREAELFITIREVGSLRQAAMRLELSTAVVSRRLAALEQHLGARLFLRSTRRLEITEAGARFHREALKLLAAARATVASVQPSQSLRGSVVVSASVTYGLLEAMPAIEQIMNQHPELEIELRLEDRFSDLLADGVDVAVRAGTSSPDSESIIARQVRAIECHLVAAPAYVRKARSPKTPDQLVDHPLLGGAGLGAGSTLRLHYNGEEYAVTLSRRLRTRTLLAVRHAAVHGLGIAVLPDFACDAMIADRTLTRILPRASLPTLAVTALYRVERRGDPAVRAVVAALQS